MNHWVAQIRSNALAPFAALIMGVLLMAACSPAAAAPLGQEDGTPTATVTPEAGTPSMDTATPSPTPGSEEEEASEEDMEITAADLRVMLNLLLQEHVYLTLAATDEMMRGEDDGFEDAEAALDEHNTQPLADLIGAVHGDDAREAFVDLWSSHIGFFFDYAEGVEADDEDMMEEAEESLDGYVSGIAEFLSGANESLTEDAVAQIFEGHVAAMLPAIEAQEEDSDENAYEAAWEAAEHVSGGADALAAAIVEQNSDMFPDEPIFPEAGDGMMDMATPSPTPTP